jgi:glycerol uptake facilitator protein
VFAVIIPVAPATAAAINPARSFGPMLIQQFAGGDVQWTQLPVYVGAQLVAGVLAALSFGLLSRTPADRATAPGVDLAAPHAAEPQAQREGAAAS